MTPNLTESQLPFYVPPPIGKRDYVVGQQFMAKYNPYFIIKFQDEVIEVMGGKYEVPTIEMYIKK